MICHCYWERGQPKSYLFHPFHQFCSWHIYVYKNIIYIYIHIYILYIYIYANLLQHLFKSSSFHFLDLGPDLVQIPSALPHRNSLVFSRNESVVASPAPRPPFRSPSLSPSPSGWPPWLGIKVAHPSRCLLPWYLVSLKRKRPPVLSL